MTTAVPESLAAALADRYTLLRELGAGGMATVYLARDVKHGRDVAIKVLHPELAAVLGAERFLSEIRTTASLQHPRILPLFDSGEAGGQLFYVMPYVEGETLRGRLDRDTQLPVADAVQLAREVAGALQYAHERGIIHRDIKPENILLQGAAGDQHALVADFGIALAVQQAGGARMTQTGLSLGTPQYMAPEQAMGEKQIDARADVYALGAVTYEMLSGEPPFTGPNNQAIVARVLTATPTPLSDARTTVPTHVADAVHAALQKLPADRPATVREFAEGLAGRSTSIGTSARTVTNTASAQPTPRRRTWLLAAALLGPVIGALAGWWLRAPGAASADARPTFTALVPRPNEWWSDDGSTYAVSPNGRLVALVASRPDWRGITIRSLDSLGVRELPNTDGAGKLFFSRDNRSLGFSQEGQLRVLDLASGSVRTLCPAPSMAGADWGADDVILYTPYGNSRVFRTSLAKNECAATTLRVPNGNQFSQPRPRFLADGRHFVLNTVRASYLGEVGRDSLRLLFDQFTGTAIVAGGEWLLFRVRDAVGVFAQRIDVAAGTLTGDRLRLIDSTRFSGGNTSIAASLSGTVIALAAESPGTDSAVENARVSMDGRILERLPAVKQNHYLVPALSPSRQFLATAGVGLGRYDIARHSWNPLPNPSRSVVGGDRLHWVGSDTLIAFAQDAAIDSVFQLNTSTGARALLFAEPSGRNISLGGRSRDGRWWLFTLSADTSVRFAEAWVFDATTRTTRKLFDEEVAVREPQLSPDGRLVTYEVRNGPRRGLYVRPFATPGVPSAVVSGHVDYHAWSDDGRAIYFARASRTIEVIDMNAAGSPVGAPRIVVPTSTLEGMSDSHRAVRFTLIPGTREMYVNLNDRRARALVVLQNFEAFAARGR